MCDLGDFYILPDTTSKGFVSPPGTKLRIFVALNECANLYTIAPLLNSLKYSKLSILTKLKASSSQT